MLFIGQFEANFIDWRCNFDHMTTKKEIIAYAVSMILKAALLAATWATRFLYANGKRLGR